MLISAEEFLPRERAVIEAMGTLGLAGLWLNHNPSPRVREGLLAVHASVAPQRHA